MMRRSKCSRKSWDIWRLALTFFLYSLYTHTHYSDCMSDCMISIFKKICQASLVGTILFSLFYSVHAAHSSLKPPGVFFYNSWTVVTDGEKCDVVCGKGGWCDWGLGTAIGKTETMSSQEWSSVTARTYSMSERLRYCLYSNNRPWERNAWVSYSLQIIRTCVSKILELGGNTLEDTRTSPLFLKLIWEQLLINLESMYEFPSHTNSVCR